MLGTRKKGAPERTLLEYIEVGKDLLRGGRVVVTLRPRAAVTLIGIAAGGGTGTVISMIARGAAPVGAARVGTARVAAAATRGALQVLSLTKVLLQNRQVRGREAANVGVHGAVGVLLKLVDVFPVMRDLHLHELLVKPIAGQISDLVDVLPMRAHVGGQIDVLL
jgi:hypothetical protein